MPKKSIIAINVQTGERTTFQSTDEAAAALGIKSKDQIYCAVNKRATCHGYYFERPPAEPKVKVESKVQRLDVIRARELYDAGKSDIEIADELDVNRDTVGKWRRREGLQYNYAPPRGRGTVGASNKRTRMQMSRIAQDAMDAKAAGFLSYGTYKAAAYVPPFHRGPKTDPVKRRPDNRCDNCILRMTRRCPAGRGVAAWKNCGKFKPGPRLDISIEE